MLLKKKFFKPPYSSCTPDDKLSDVVKKLTFKWTRFIFDGDNIPNLDVT